jgi:hypothetical protein
MSTYKSRKPAHMRSGAGQGGATVSCLCCKKKYSYVNLIRHWNKVDRTPEQNAVWKYWMGLQGNCCRKYDRTGRKVNRTLTVEQIEILLDLAGITIWDVGKKKGQYNLARYEDLGDYAWGNCRFVTKEENLNELFEFMDKEAVYTRRGENIYKKSQEMFS